MVGFGWSHVSSIDGVDDTTTTTTTTTIIIVMQERSFVEVVAAANGGADCPPTEERACATDPCTTTTTTTTTLQPCDDPVMLGALTKDAAGVTLAGPWPAVMVGEASVVDCASSAGPSWGSFSGTVARYCVDGELANSTESCIPANCTAALDNLT